jgi:hypothetical protein
MPVLCAINETALIFIARHFSISTFGWWVAFEISDVRHDRQWLILHAIGQNAACYTNSISERVDDIGEGGDGADELWIALDV